MKQLDLQNSIDVISVARSWLFANTTALDLAQRLTSTADIDAEVKSLSARIGPLRRRESFWYRLSLVALVPVAVMGVAGVFTVFGFDSAKLLLDLVGIDALRLCPLLGFVFWLVTMNCGGPASSARKYIEAQLDLLTPVLGSDDCQTALKFVEAGRPEVLAWRDIALYDRDVLYRFDVEVLRALHCVSQAARSACEKKAAIDAACRRLYGLADSSVDMMSATSA